MQNMHQPQHDRACLPINENYCPPIDDEFDKTNNSDLDSLFDSTSASDLESLFDNSDNAVDTASGPDSDSPLEVVGNNSVASSAAVKIPRRKLRYGTV
jgi:hypothetical protein